MAEPRTGDARGPGLREALLVGALVVVVVLLAAAVTSMVPDSAREVVFRTPLLILVLIGGTALVLWRITRPARPDSSGRPGRP
nr:hypothetical protein [Chloroflexota bacterium]